MTTKKITKGSIIRLTSFAHKFPDGAAVGLSASPEGIPDKDKEVFTAMLLSKEPLLLTKEQEELYALNSKTELLLLGYIHMSNIPGYIRERIGVLGTEEVRREIRKALDDSEVQ